MLSTVKNRRSYSADYKAKIVIAGLSKNCSVSELCRRNNIAVSLYYGSAVINKIDGYGIIHRHPINFIVRN